MHTIAERKLLMLRPSEIQPAKDQPRHYFDTAELNRLAESIATSGIIQPLSVRRNSVGEYELIAGERRLRAAKIAGLRRVPCILHKTDDATAAFYAIVENMQRSNLTIFEESESIRQLIQRYGLTQAEAALRLGLAQSTLSNKLRLLRLDPTLQKRIVDAHLSERHARALLRLPMDERADVLERIIRDSLTMSQAEELVEEILNPKIQEPPVSLEPPKAPEKVPEEPIRKMAIGDVRLFANSLTKLVDTMQNAGIYAQTRKTENEKYIEYKVRIHKDCLQSGCSQLKIC